MVESWMKFFLWEENPGTYINVFNNVSENEQFLLGSRLLFYSVLWRMKLKKTEGAPGYFFSKRAKDLWRSLIGCTECFGECKHLCCCELR